MPIREHMTITENRMVSPPPKAWYNELTKALFSMEFRPMTMLTTGTIIPTPATCSPAPITIMMTKKNMVTFCFLSNKMFSFFNILIMSVLCSVLKSVPSVCK